MSGRMGNKKVSVLAWTDFRNGTFGSYVGYYPDFGMRMVPTVDSIRANGGNITINMNVPSVKSYTDTVLVTSATITPTPGTGSFTITYPNTNRLTSYPGSVPIRIQTSGTVTAGTYTLNVTAAGPNGTPVHKRTATIIVGASVTGIGNDVTINNYELFQNYPNPFNPTTRIDFNLIKDSKVKFTVYDAVGKQVVVMDLGNQLAGKNYVMFNAGTLSSGVYFYKIQAGEFTDIKKMFLLK